MDMGDGVCEQSFFNFVIIYLFFVRFQSSPSFRPFSNASSWKAELLAGFFSIGSNNTRKLAD